MFSSRKARFATPVQGEVSAYVLRPRHTSLRSSHFKRIRGLRVDSQSRFTTSWPWQQSALRITVENRGRGDPCGSGSLNVVQDCACAVRPRDVTGARMCPAGPGVIELGDELVRVLNSDAQPSAHADLRTAERSHA